MAVATHTTGTTTITMEAIMVPQDTPITIMDTEPVWEVNLVQKAPIPTEVLQQELMELLVE